MNFTVLRRPRTQALLDGRIEMPDLSASWRATNDPLGWNLPEHEQYRDLAADEIDGGEMSISSFLQAKARGAPIVALPIFLKRGFVQRSLICSVDSSLHSPEQLAGKKVGLVGYTSSMAVWMRGVLRDGYRFDSASCQWLALSGASRETQSLQIPSDFSPDGITAWEELDGYEHELDRREAFLLSLLAGGKLDAVVSFQARIADSKIRPLFDEKRLWSDAVNAKLYPINHLFVVKTGIVTERPELVHQLIALFRQARGLWIDYLPASARDFIEKEMTNLGFDPFAYQLGEVEVTTFEAMIRFLQRDGLIDTELRPADLFFINA